MNAIRFLAVLTCVVCGACATRDVNPLSPAATTGYVDFYTDSSMDLSWNVKRASPPGGETREVFSDYTPLPGNILRLPTPAGASEFTVWFMNRVTTGPQKVQVTVANAKVTAVHVTLAPAGSTAVRSESAGYGGARNTGRGVRHVQTSATEEQATVRIDLAAGSPQEYRPKEQMAYYNPAAK